MKIWNSFTASGILYAFLYGVILVLILGTMCLPVQAGSCGYIQQSYYAPQVTYAAPTYYEPYVEKKRIVLLEYQFVPSFPIGYAPAAAPSVVAAPQPIAAGASPCEVKFKELSERFSALEAKLGAGKMPPVGDPGEPPPPPPAPAGKYPMLVSKCAGCHDKTVSAEKGKGLTLFANGAPVIWSDAMTGKVLKQIASGKMPPPGTAKITPDEFSTLFQELADLHAK